MSVQEQIDRLNNAKTSIGNAIAAKGVSVPSGTKLDGMAALIEGIEDGVDVSGADATAENVLSGKKFVGANGVVELGTMPDNSGNNLVIHTVTPVQIPRGYTDGECVAGISSDEISKIIPDNIRKGVSILGVSGVLDPDMPSVYTEVPYIQSSGGQYIDTEIYATKNTTVEADVDIYYLHSGRNQWVFGSRDNDDSSNRYEFIYISSVPEYRIYYGNNNASLVNSGVSPLGRCTIRVDAQGRGDWASVRMIKNGNTYQSYPLAASLVSSNSLYLFSCNSTNAATESISMRLYSFKAYEDGVLIGDFVPVLRRDGKLGLLNKITNIFHGNIGTGGFTTDPNAEISEAMALAILSGEVDI